jgi:outer membrane protein W
MKRIALAVGIVLALAAAQPAFAQQETHWKLFGAFAYVSPLGEDDVTIGSIQDSIQASNEAGWEAGIEWRPAKLIGIEVSYLEVTNEVEFGGTSIGEVDLNPYTLALNFHLIPSKYFDLYVAPVVSFVDWGSIDLSNGSSVDANSETAYGAAVGVDISFHKNFAFIGGVRWLSLDLSTDDPAIDASVAVDPLISRVGFAFRF